MSTLTLVITADTAGLTQIKEATAELKALLGASQVPSLTAIRELTTTVRALEFATQKSKVATDASTVSLQGASAAAAAASQKLNLTTASYSKLAAVTKGYSAAITAQKATLKTNLDQMSALSWVNKVHAQNLQALAGVVSALDAEFTKQVSIKSAILIKTNEQVLAEKALTQTLLAEAVASGKLSTAEAVRLGHKKLQIEATAALNSARAKSLSLQIAARASSAVSPAALLGLKQQALAAANSAAALGSMTRAEVEAIAVSNGLASSLTTKLVPALNATTASSSALRDATRGAAGAGGSLWMAYGQILPLMGAFVTVASTIKGIKLSAEFEAQTVFMNALAEATGDYSMSLEDVQSHFLAMRGLSHTASELAESSKELVKAGFSSVQATAEIAAMSKTATVAQEELSLVTKGVAAQYRAWGVAAVGSERGVSSLAETANMMGFAALKTALDFGELNSMLAHTTELGPLTGATFAELTALLGFMSNMGIKGTKAATSLRTGMLRLQTMSGSLKVSMEKLRVPFSAFTESGQLKDLTTMFEDLGESLAPLSNEARIDALNRIFNLRALKGGVAGLRAMSHAIDDGTFSFRSLVAGIEDAGASLTFIDGIFAELSKTTKEMWKILKAEAATEMAAAFTDASGEMQGLLTVVRAAIADGTFRSLIDDLALIAQGLVWTTSKVVEAREALVDLGTVQVFGPLLGNLLNMKRRVKEAKTETIGLRDALVSLGAPIVLGPVLGNLLSLKKLMERSPERATELKESLIAVGAPTVLGPLFGNLLRLKNLMEQTPEGATELKERLVSLGAPQVLGALLANIGNIKSAFTKAKGAVKDFRAGGAEGEGDSLFDPKVAALAEWHRQQEIKVEREAIQSVTQMRASANANELGLLSAKFRAQTISEEQFIAESRELRSSDLTLRIGEAAKKLDLLKEQATFAKQFAEENEKDKSAQIALASALSRVATQANKLNQLRGKKLYEPLLAAEVDIARTNKFKASLQGVRDVAADLADNASKLAGRAVLNEAEVRQADKLLAIDRNRARAVEALQDAQVAAGSYQYTLVQEAYDKQTKAAEEYYRQEQKLRGDWSAGIEKSLADYAFQATDVFSQVGNVVTRAFQGMEDALVEFTKSGKLNFRDMVDNMIEDVTRLLYRQALAGLVSDFAASSFGGFGSGATKATVPEFTGDVSTARTVNSANGNVFPHKALSDYSGTVVNKPTVFPFANGIGLMGEDGDEAILPLKRGRDGKLGVATESSQTKMAPVTVNVYNQNGEKKEAESRSRLDVNGLVIDVFLRDMAQNGPMKRALKGGI